MAAMDPAVPTPVSPWWGALVGLGLFLIAVGVCVWNWRHAEPVGTPPPVEPLKAVTDGFNTHAETAAALTAPDVTQWLPRDTDPRDDAEGVLVEPPPFLTGQRSADLPPDLDIRVPTSVVDHMIERVERYLKEQVS
jgi:hypothetical protein